jgi:hypothetical protein
MFRFPDHRLSFRALIDAITQLSIRLSDQLYLLKPEAFIGDLAFVTTCLHALEVTGVFSIPFEGYDHCRNLLEHLIIRKSISMKYLPRFALQLNLDSQPMNFSSLTLTRASWRSFHSQSAPKPSPDAVLWFTAKVSDLF